MSKIFQWNAWFISSRSLAVLLAVLLICPFGQAIQKEKKSAPSTPVLWRDPGAVESLDFAGGVAGRAGAPKPPFTFIEESLSGTNPKVRVSDANGVQWTAKFGTEVNAETFATRLVWAAGYFVEPDYFVASGRIGNVGKLTRAKSHVKSDGNFTNARFEMQRDKGVKKIDEDESWSWVANPFTGTKELHGLKVLLMLTSNWDNKDVRDVKRGSNTAIFRYPAKLSSDGTAEDRYIVTDWGGSMGKWGGYTSREKWDCKGFKNQTKDFIKGVKGNFVQFGYSGQHTEDFKNDIKVSDVKWLLQYLGGITDAQLRDGLQASGATPEEVECFTQSLRDRINQLKAVAR